MKLTPDQIQVIAERYSHMIMPEMYEAITEEINVLMAQWLVEQKLIRIEEPT